MSALPKYTPETAAKRVFGYSPITRSIEAEAEWRLVSQWTLLGGALTQAALATPYNWLLPAVVEDVSGLNMLIAHTGPSGSGKGAGKIRIFDWPSKGILDCDLDNGEQRLAEVLVPITVASGEAFGSLFVEMQTMPGLDGKGKVTVPVRIRQAAWVDFDEIDQVTAIGSRQGSTLTFEIRKIVSGSGIGTHTKTKANRATVRAHSYRLVVTVAVQPLRAAPLFAEEAGGTLQRVLFFDATVPTVAEADLDDDDLDVTPTAAPMPITLPDFGRGLSTVGDDGPVYFFEVDTEVRREIVRDRKTGKWEGVDAHRNLLRLKVAAAMAVLHGSTRIDADVWDVAEAILYHSVHVRESVKAELQRAEQEAATRRAIATSNSEITSASARELGVENVAQAMVRWMRKNPDKAPTADGLRKAAVANVQRSLVPEALDLLLSRGHIVAAGASRLGTATYRLNGGTGERGNGPAQVPYT